MSDKSAPWLTKKAKARVSRHAERGPARVFGFEAQEIDAEIFRLIKDGHDQAVKILNENMTALNNMAGALLEYETIDRRRSESIGGRADRSSR